MAARSTCVKCGNQTFETVREMPVGAAFYYLFIQCARCGGVVGVVESQNAGDKLRSLEEAIRLIARQVGATIQLPRH